MLKNDNHDKNDNLNPFSPQQPAQPEYFAGRKEELNEFGRMAVNSAKLRIPTPANYAILGTWGQGKTSLLYKFRQMVIEDLQKQIKCACIYFCPKSRIMPKLGQVYLGFPRRHSFNHNIYK